MHGFTETFAEPLNDFTVSNFVQQGPAARDMIVTVPFLSTATEGVKRICDLATTNFADDTQRLVLTAEGEGLKELVARANLSSDLLTEAIGSAGYKQNTGKLVTLPILSGEGSRAAFRTLRSSKGAGLPGSISESARSLGAWINSWGSFAHEKLKRVAATRQAKFDAGPLLRQPRLPYKLKRIFLICYIQNCALSCTESFVLGKADYAALDVTILQAARLAMTGRATFRDTEGCHDQQASPCLLGNPMLRGRTSR